MADECIEHGVMMCSCIASTMQACMQGIAHRALTLDTLMVDFSHKYLTVKIGSFGASKSCTSLNGPDPYPETVDHTPSYMSPEMLMIQMREGSEDLNRCLLLRLGWIAYHTRARVHCLQIGIDRSRLQDAAQSLMLSLFAECILREGAFVIQAIM